MPAILLTEKAKGFKLDLKNGFNVVDFVALNQGTSGPNTAEIIVYDDQGKLIQLYPDKHMESGYWSKGNLYYLQKLTIKL